MVLCLCSKKSCQYFGSKVGPNFQLGYYVRALMLLERHLFHAHGFVVDAIETKIKKLRGKLTSLGYSTEQVSGDNPVDFISSTAHTAAYYSQIREARLNMGFDLRTDEEKSDANEELQRPAHDCRSKIGVYKTPEECRRILYEFKTKFSWMFTE
ncbi:unnamed protein product [Strongylus vulgaris]|uniref:Uncharacterized protein n=1 Tax=Strongylus vulgaris TaxID=40348 RepID=A0A3P7J336_STRVU|nr:unnamed protein product [Strongylus vulgaris]